MAAPPAYHESLPYIDPEASPEALSAARALIAAESSESSSSPAPLPALKEPSFSPAILTELTRLSSSTPSQPLDLSRYEAQDLPPQQPSSSSVEHLKQPLSNAYISSSYLSSRAQNLNLLDKHGRNAWLLSNYHLEANLRSLEVDLADAKREIDLTNAARARRQNDVKAEMQSLEQNWRTGVGRVLETEIAVEEVKAQIREELRNRAGGGASAEQASS